MTKTKPLPNLPHLKKQLQAAGVRQQDIAARVGVTKQHVCSVLAGRYKSWKVVMAAQILLVEARAASGRMK